MSDFKPIAIIKLQNLLSSEKIEQLKSKFIREHNIEEFRGLKKDKGIILLQGNNRLIEVKFEDELKEILLQATDDLKAEIKQANIELSNPKKIKYFNLVLNGLNSIKERNIETFKIFPICYKPQELIEKHLKEEYMFSQISQLNNSYFTLKPKYKRKDLQKIYDFITIEGYIDDEIVSFDDFQSVLFEKETQIRLPFNCASPLIICILKHLLSPLFTDFSRKRIIESGRFITKSTKKKKGVPISESIYDTNLSRLSKLTKDQDLRDKSKIDNFFKENFS